MLSMKYFQKFFWKRSNHQNWCAAVTDLELPLQVFPEQSGTRHAAFAFPMLISEDSPLNRREVCSFLENKGIQTRPISGANLAMQPMFSKIPRVTIEGDLPVATAVQQRGFFVGQSHAFGDSQGDLLIRALQEAFSSC